MIHTTNRNAVYTGIIVFITLVIAAWLLVSGPNEQTVMSHDEHAANSEEVSKGPHGGRLLEADSFAVELTIFEKGIPPEFHVYPYFEGKPVALDAVTLNIELTRLDGQVDKFPFKPQADYLRGDGVVTEPHSFDVSVTARYQGNAYKWEYENYEGRTHIAANMAIEAGIATETAGPGIIHETLTLTGRVQTDPNRLSHVRARFPGVVRSIKRNLGEVVKAGDVLATVQSNESLQTYSLTAPIAGLIVKREIQPGEATGDTPLFIIADLSQVWVEFDVFGRDLNQVRSGQDVKIESLDGQQMQGNLDWVSPLAAHASQSVHARVVLPNPNGQLRPGQFVRGEVTIAEHKVPLAVRLSALQGFRDFTVVFARFGETYEVRMLELGRRNHEWVEVLDGLKTGTEYVTQNSYIIKADIEKSGASHDH